MAHAKQFKIDEANAQLTKNREAWNKNLAEWLLFIQQLNSEDLECWQEKCDAFHDKAASLNAEIVCLNLEIENIRSVI